MEIYSVNIRYEFFRLHIFRQSTIRGLYYSDRWWGYGRRLSQPSRRPPYSRHGVWFGDAIVNLELGRAPPFSIGYRHARLPSTFATLAAVLKSHILCTAAVVRPELIRASRLWLRNHAWQTEWTIWRGPDRIAEAVEFHWLSCRII